MTTEDYEQLAKIVGNTFVAMRRVLGEEGRTLVYDNLYVPLTDYLAESNEDFILSIFAFQVATAEQV